MLKSRKKIFGLQNGLKRLFCITIEVGIDIDVKILQDFMILMSYIVMDINCSIYLHMNFWLHEFVNESLATVLMVEKSVTRNTVSYLSTFECYRAISCYHLQWRWYHLHSILHLMSLFNQAMCFLLHESSHDLIL